MEIPDWVKPNNWSEETQMIAVEAGRAVIALLCAVLRERSLAQESLLKIPPAGARK